MAWAFGPQWARLVLVVIPPYHGSKKREDRPGFGSSLLHTLGLGSAPVTRMCLTPCGLKIHKPPLANRLMVL